MYVASYAKINLFLEVLSRRADLYHEVNTVLCSIDLCDNIKYTLTKRPHLKLWCNREELDSTDNLIYKIASYLQLRFKPLHGIEIELEKNVPIAAGLGGGSSNAATTIMVLNLLWGLNLSMSEMNQIASEFGSDINYFLCGGNAFARGRGEIVEPLPEVNINNILLVNPGLYISAGEAYSLVKPGYSPRIWSGSDVRGDLFNRLEPGIRQKHKVVDEILETMYLYGPLSAMMSGSGSTCFAIFNKEELLLKCKAKFDQKGYWTRIVKSITREEYHRCFQS